MKKKQLAIAAVLAAPLALAAYWWVKTTRRPIEEITDGLVR